MKQKLTSNKKWELLNKSYKIAALAPSSKPSHFTKVKNFPGINLLYPSDFIDSGVSKFHANSDVYRADHLRQLLYSNERNLIIEEFNYLVCLWWLWLCKTY